MLTLLLATYWLAVAGLCIYGLNCYVLCAAFRRGRVRNLQRLQRVRAEFAARHAETDLPIVTVQLPIYNERYVVARLLRAIAAFDWPADRLQVQVLDDSTDDTTAIVAQVAAELAADGLCIEHRHRLRREGFKAGALRDGLASATGELIAIFDADFVPAPDFLRRTVPLLQDPAVGLVQARWGHLNRDHSPLTRAQGLAIDGHFSIEQAGRCWSGRLLNFNGTAGVWRRRAIADAGGWQADTLTEDLDLSYRAQLCGWRIEYALDVEVPAEIPAEISAFKSQQRRWAKGSIQTAKKLLPRVLRSPLPVASKLQAVLHLTHYVVHPLMLCVALLALPVLLFWDGGRLATPVFALLALMLAIGSCGPTALYVASQRALYADWRPRLRHLPLLMLLGSGIAISNTRAVLEALLGIDSAFVRTPKRNLTDTSAPRDNGGYRLPVDTVFVFEAALACYSAWGVAVYLERGRWLIGPFLALYAASFGWVAWLSVHEQLQRRGAIAASAAPARTAAAAPGQPDHRIEDLVEEPAT